MGWQILFSRSDRRATEQTLWHLVIRERAELPWVLLPDMMALAFIRRIGRPEM